MSLTKLTDDLNVIGGLSDQPTMTASELKQKFDEAGNLIKSYINNVLTEEIAEEILSGVSSALSSAKTYADGIVQALEDGAVATNTQNIETNAQNIETQAGEIQELSETVEDLSQTSLKASSFAVTTTTVKTKNTGIVYTSTRDADESQYVTKSGYYPIALVGVRSASVSSNRGYRFGYLSNQENEKCLAHWYFANENGESINEQDLPNCVVSILWVKL